MIAKPERPINIKNLVIEEPQVRKETFSFNLADEVSASYVVDLINHLSPKDWHFEAQAKQLALLARLMDIEPEFSPRARVRLAQEYKRVDANWWMLPGISATRKLSEPQFETSVMYKSFSDHAEDWVAIKNGPISMIDVVERFRDLKICLPQKFEDLAFTDEDIQKMIRNRRASNSLSLKANLTYAAHLKFMFGIEPEELLSKTEITQALKLFYDAKQSPDAEGYIELATELAILGAKSVEIYKSGTIKLVPKAKADPLTDQAIPLPETRRF